MGFSGATGFRFDSSGLNFFAAGGIGAGLKGSPFSLSYTPEVEVPHTAETRMSVGGSAAYGLGLGIAKSGEYQPATYSIKNPSTEYSGVVGLGGDVYVRKEISIPIFGRQSPASKNSDLSKPTHLNATKSQQSSIPQTNANTTSRSSAPSVLDKTSEK